jgi:hypothetical protein
LKLHGPEEKLERKKESCPGRHRSPNAILINQFLSSKIVHDMFVGSAQTVDP